MDETVFPRFHLSIYHLYIYISPPSRAPYCQLLITKTVIFFQSHRRGADKPFSFYSHRVHIAKRLMLGRIEQTDTKIEQREIRET